MTTLTPPLERIDLRTTPEIKELIVRAASAAGVSLSAFLIASAQDRAKQLLAERETLTFSPRDWNAFLPRWTTLISRVRSSKLPLRTT